MSPDPAADPASIRASLEELDRSAPLAEHGAERARRRAALFDGILAELFERAGAPAGVALVAVGGYGRAQMLPRSDLDLLLLHAPDVDPAALADAVLYPLWDAGVEVGHGVRTHDECLALCARDLDARTAMLDARHVAGNGALSAGTIGAVRATVAADVAAFAETLRRDRQARIDRFGDAAHGLEPDLKRGAGGLRDANLLRWLEVAEARSGVDAAWIADVERRAVAEAEEFLMRVRSAVQLLTGKRHELLLAELQTELALAWGLSDRPGWTAADQLLRRVFEAGRWVGLVVTLALDRFEAGGVHGEPEPSALRPAGGANGGRRGHPADTLSSLAELAETGSTPSPSFVEQVAALELPAGGPWEDETFAAFARVLAAGAPGARALDLLDRLGQLVALIPEWADVRCRPQRDPYHRRTVDAHLTATAALLAETFDGQMPPDQPADGPRAFAEDPIALTVAGLLHDIGKVGEGEHVATGVRIAGDILARMRAPAGTAELVRFLVAEHLLLPDTATRRDLSDEDLILDVAARIGSPSRLAALASLAEADAAMTGPAATTPWRRALLAELVAKVRHVLERGEMGPELAERLSERIGRVRVLLSDEPEDDVDRFVLRMPRRYFLAVDPDRIAAQFPSIAPPLGSDEVRVSIEPRGEGSELLVVAADRPGLLSWIAGALAVEGASIRSAQVFTTEDGVAVDVFELEGDGPGDGSSLRDLLAEALRGSTSMERLVAEKRRRYPSARATVPITIRVDTSSSDFSTVIEVGAADRIGLLHDITRALAELRVDVHLAKVATFDGRVVDAFYVRDALGRKIVEEAALAEVADVIRRSLEA